MPRISPSQERMGYLDLPTFCGRSKKGYAASAQRLAELQRKAEHEATGLRSPFADHVAKPLRDHLVDYIAVLKSCELSAVYVDNTERWCKELLNGCGFKRLAARR